MRRSPKVGVFLALGAVAGALAAVIITLATPQDGRYPIGQVLGFLLLLLVPVGAVLGGLLAVVLDAVATRRARVLEAERIRPGDDGA
ncbi:MAG: potassium transporter Trk [Amnibacterium sp.]